MKRKLAIIVSAVIVFLVFWFLCVDGVIFVESCPDCSHGMDIFQIRIFTIPIYQQMADERISILQKIATDMGIECKHPNLSGYEKWRFWGILIPQEVRPGIDSLSGDDNWYDDKARAIVKDMVKTSPSLRDDFSNRVLKDHDWKYLKAFVQKTIALKDGKPVPTPQQ
jgi:hypothetical protein